MNQNQSGKKLVSFVLIFIGIMVISPMGLISVLDGFPVFAIVPIVMFVLFGLFSFLIVKTSSKTIKCSILSGSSGPIPLSTVS